MATLSSRSIACVMRAEAPSISVRICGSGISRLMVGSRNASASSASTPRPASTRASNSGIPWRCAIVSARAAPRSSRRSRQPRPGADRATPKKKRSEVFNAIAGKATIAIPRTAEGSPGLRCLKSVRSWTKPGGSASVARRLATPSPRDLARWLFEVKLRHLPVLGTDPAHGAGGRAHHHGFGLDHVLAELDPAQHGAIGHAGGGEQTIALHHVFDLVFFLRILDAH